MKKIFSYAIACAAVITMCGLTGCSRDDGTVGDRSDHSSSAPHITSPATDEHKDDGMMTDDHLKTDDHFTTDDHMGESSTPGNDNAEGGATGSNNTAGGGVMP